MKRRAFLAASASALAVACTRTPDAAPNATSDARTEPRGRLIRRPHAPGRDLLPPGRHALKLATGRDGFISVPNVTGAAPLLIALHGAGQSADLWEQAIPVTDELGVILLVPESRDKTWEVVTGDAGRDVAFIDAALGMAFTRCSIDAKRCAVSGFSDGASYALTLGITNGDLLTHIIAFSPGFIGDVAPHGKPPIFITHGTDDRILPIGSTSRRIVPRLQAEGYRVEYREFAGGHEIKPALFAEAVRLLKG
jgi:phospholipase/carboxylesterase